LQNNNSFIWLRKDGLYNCDNSLDWEKTDTFIAIGSGAMAAEALLRHGLSAEEAVKGACDVDLYSSEPIKIYQLLDKDKTVIHT
jgi:ATP-dependent protease HslVU (ClpYQ) peptidase subunit